MVGDFIKVTGQYSYTNDFGLMFYNARWYDPALGRFAQADTIVPGGVQGLDRYAYVNNSPLNYVDPTGHFTCSNDRNSDDYCPSRGGAASSSGGGVPNAPESAQERLDLFNEFADYMGNDLDYLNAEITFAQWIYSSGRLDSDYWNDANSYILMSMIASMEAINLSSSELSKQDTAVQAWVAFLNNPTEGNFWYAHNIALRHAYNQSDISNETEAEQIFINTAYNNVITLGDDCANGGWWACTLAGNSNISLTTAYNYPQNYPATNTDALSTMQYDGNIIGSAINHYWSIFTGCIGVSICFGPGN